MRQRKLKSVCENNVVKRSIYAKTLDHEAHAPRDYDRVRNRPSKPVEPKRT